jgi:single-stranded-DNA-specific exonuclease
MTEVELPKPLIKNKAYNSQREVQCLAAGLHPIVAKIIASRPLVLDLPVLEALSPRLKNLFSPFNMADMERAAERVAMAIIKGEYIGIETDHDCDGQTSHALLYYNLNTHFKHPATKICSYIGHRLTEGYGLSQSVALRILEDSPRVSLVITADNGSSDEPRIRLLKEAGIDVIVTDHHEMPTEGFPKSAYACLNPTRKDCSYGDPYIAGCMVAWLLCAAVRQKLISKDYLPTSAPSLMDSLDFVAVGTIADCVSIARSVNNRAVVSYGLRLIESGIRPCWRVIKPLIPGSFKSEDLGFKVAPLLNSDGRLATAFGSVSFLLATTDEEAQKGLVFLQAHNAERKTIQQEIVLKGLIEAKLQISKGKSSLCIYLKEGHVGVQGIAASRIKDVFGRPTVFFAPKISDLSLLTGSIRGIEEFHVRQALQTICQEDPNLLVAFGGHKGAGGLTLQEKDFEKFSEIFEVVTCLQLKKIELGPVIWTEGVLSIEHFNLDLLEILNKLEPFGREFEPPIFEINAYLREIRFIGDGTHARMQLEVEGKRLTGVWFKIRQTIQAPIFVKIGNHVKVAFSVKENIFANQRTIDMHIIYMEKIE